MKCKKCGKELSKENFPLDWRSHYCNDCVKVFDDAIKNGAIVIRRRTQRESNTFPYEISGKNIKAEAPAGINQIKAIKRAKHLALKNNEKILFNYEPRGSMWFLEDYLEAHPKIKEDVERPSTLSRIFRKNGRN